eukprot:scaffold287_cov337-Pavlova_lutheri.AAC.1
MGSSSEYSLQGTAITFCRIRCLFCKIMWEEMQFWKLDALYGTAGVTGPPEINMYIVMYSSNIGRNGSSGPTGHPIFPIHDHASHFPSQDRPSRDQGLHCFHPSNCMPWMDLFGCPVVTTPFVPVSSSQRLVLVPVLSQVPPSVLLFVFRPASPRLVGVPVDPSVRVGPSLVEEESPPPLDGYGPRCFGSVRGGNPRELGRRTPTPLQYSATPPLE